MTYKKKRLVFGSLSPNMTTLDRILYTLIYIVYIVQVQGNSWRAGLR